MLKTKRYALQEYSSLVQDKAYKFRGTLKGIQNQEDKDFIQTLIEQEGGVQDIQISDNQVSLTLHPSASIINLLEKIRKQNKGISFKPYEEFNWLWQGKYMTKYAVSGNHIKTTQPPLLMIHGFGASTGHFRKLIATLSPEYKVYSIDLLGFGQSQKPLGVRYNPDLWKDQVSDFIKEVIQQPTIIVGNSLGSLVGLYATKFNQEYVKGLILLNVSGGMNQKGLLNDSVQLKILWPIFQIVEFLIRRDFVARFLYQNFKSYNNVRKILAPPLKKNIFTPLPVYLNPEAVNEELLDLLMEPADDEGAMQVFQSVFIEDPGPRPEDLFDAIQDIPTCVLWGEKDPWNPVDGKVAKYFKSQQKQRDVKFVILPDQGHCPMDDRYEETSTQITQWLKDKFQQ